jgi:GT2 family glycosyltransferase
MDLADWQDQQRALRVAVGKARGVRDQTLTRGAAASPRPLVSVIVAAWNSAETIERCLTQLSDQDYESREIIVIDDGSSDATASIVRRLQRGRGATLRLVEHGRNRGLARARNTGLDAARGEIVAFMDADGFADPAWLSAVVHAFGDDPRIGGVASTVFMDANPMVINGAGGTTNRQGWAADLALGSSFEYAELPKEALYAMGCGMAFRRSTIERVGRFDDHIRNYYDDVEYGLRVWRRGYRVAVACDAWVDHRWGGGVGSTRQALLCERHRMRVVLKHWPASAMVRWCRQEIAALAGVSWSRRARKLRALAWNLVHLPSVLGARVTNRGVRRPPAALVHPSWGEAFPVGVPDVFAPQVQEASARVAIGDPSHQSQMLYGWFPVERVGGQARRWAGRNAALFATFAEPARRLRLEYAHPPVETGGVDVQIRPAHAHSSQEVVWRTHLAWQFIERSVENHPLELAAGDYEVLFSAQGTWSDPPRDDRELSFALAEVELSSVYQPPWGGLDMASPESEEQLVYGWYERERDAGRDFRWMAQRAAITMRLDRASTGAQLDYRMAPAPNAGIALSVRRVTSEDVVWSERIPWENGGWQRRSLQLTLEPGDYVMAFEADTVWSNPSQQDTRFPPERRSLGLAVAALSFVGD